MMMDFDQLFAAWRSARGANDNAKIDSCVRSARRLCSSAGESGWSWLDDALWDRERKWFVSAIFNEQPVPKKLLGRMVHTGVLEKNPSANRWFIEPCVQSLGAGRVLAKLFEYLQNGSDEEKAGAASALYWVRRESGVDPDTELRQKIHNQLLHEFVNNEDLEVRRRIIPMLALDRSKYPEESAPLVAAAIQIARSHADDYIRHRVEIQLGAGGPFMAIPAAGKP